MAQLWRKGRAFRVECRETLSQFLDFGLVLFWKTVFGVVWPILHPFGTLPASLYMAHPLQCPPFRKPNRIMKFLFCNGLAFSFRFVQNFPHFLQIVFPAVAVPRGLLFVIVSVSRRLKVVGNKIGFVA